MARGMAPTLVWPDFVVAKLRHKHGLGIEPFEALVQSGAFTAFRSETHPWRLILEGVVEGKGYQLVCDVLDRRKGLLEPVTGHRFRKLDLKKGGGR